MELAIDAAEINVPLWADLTAAGVSAMLGVVYAARVAYERSIDILGICAIGMTTGIGGGVIRDVLLNVQPAALATNAYILTTLAAALLGVWFASTINKIEYLVVAMDAMAMALYLVVGVWKAYNAGLALTATVFVGVMAAVGGGVLRDILLRTDVSLVHVGSFYAVAAIAGALVFEGVIRFADAPIAGGAAMLVAFAVRMLALRYGWATPIPQPLSVDTYVKNTLDRVDQVVRRARPRKKTRQSYL